MKRLLISLYLALSSLVTFAQPTLSIPASGNIATREWVEQYLFNHFSECCSGVCDLAIDSTRQDGDALEFYLSASSDTATSIHNFSVELSQGSNVWYWNDVPHYWGEWLRIEGVVPTELVNVKIKFSNTPGCYTTTSLNLGAAPCSSGPTLIGISGIGNTSLTFNYTALGVPPGTWAIKSGGTTVRSGTFTAGAGLVPITFASLANGTYTLTLSGVNCSGSSSMGFTIAGQPACTSGPLLLSVVSPSSTGLSFTFHGVNVFGIDWKVLSGGTIVRSGNAAPSSSTVPITYTSLPDGSYSLLIAGSTCVGTSPSLPFSIASAPDTLPDEVSLTNPGVRSATQNGREFEWIESQNAQLTINSNGSVTLTCPSTKTAISGGATCYRTVYLNHIPVQGSNLTALLGSGLTLDDGANTIHVMYNTVSDPYDLINGGWYYNGTREGNGMTEYIYVGIKTIGYEHPTQSGGVKEVMRPRSLIMPAWSPLWWQDKSWQINSTTDRIFGLTTVLSNVAYADALKKVTHLQHGPVVDSVSLSRVWVNLRAYSGSTTDQIAANYPSNLGYLAMAQMDEDEFTIQQANDAYRKIYEKLQAQFGVTSPNQTNLYDDYWSPLSGGNIDLKFPLERTGKSAIWTKLRAGMANLSIARKKWGDTEGEFTVETAYSSAGWYNYHNWFSGGYLSDFWSAADGVRGYNLVYNLERMALAFPDRKRIVYGWDLFDNTASQLYAYGTFLALKFSSPSGDILLNSAVVVPHAIMEEEAFWARLIGNGYVMWNVHPRQTKDIAQWGPSFWGGGEDGSWTVPTPWKTLWRPNGGSPVNYDKNNGSHPALIYNTSNPPLGNVDVGTQGAVSGSHLFDEIENRQTTLVYASFTFTKAGVTTNGYVSGTTPTTGTAGDARVSRYGDPNYGQDNIASQAENRLPICMYGTGPGGKCIIFCNRYAAPGEVQTVTVSNGSGYTFTVKGPGLHVLTMP